jgi:site-specific DNA recombinase
VLDALKHRLLEPEHVEEFIREFHAELNRQQRDAQSADQSKRGELQQVTARLSRLIDGLLTA